ncbi:anti-virulence regulator CigR family protein [Halopseudomonas maritima]|uniref:anti-virulence regulator CigR family protein n=1 Tax=Halopseudomonas maritima TaxID=2918528 RepID=UPI001EEB7DB6|nr:anti-virulence regulator CigR family protein [Halopseudomonas maritima]UJJ32079.1 RcnB family protein [Halopseudomonas maritima]
MRIPSRSLLAASLLAIAFASPAHAKQDDRGNGNSHHAQQGNDRGQGARHNDRDPVSDHYSRPSERIQEDVIRSIFRDNREWVQRGDNLPPGIRKNLARGKPLPPGIAKQLDPRLVNRLPHYDGYEWRQIDGDVVLAEIATGIIESIIYDVIY